MMANELKSMSVQDRTNLQEEIHGVHCIAPIESPQMINDALLKLDDELRNLPIDNKRAYDRAISMNSPYVTSMKFRLKFLRADLFDVQKAAIRLAGHLDLRHKYFGDSSLMRPITIDDLSLEEKKILRLGIVQILPTRDRAGRLVMYHGDFITANQDRFVPFRIKVRHKIT